MGERTAAVSARHTGSVLLLCVDVGSTFTKAAVIETRFGALLATAAHPTTVGTDVMDGVDAVFRALAPHGRREARVVLLGGRGSADRGRRLRGGRHRRASRRGGALGGRQGRARDPRRTDRGRGGRVASRPRPTSCSWSGHRWRGRRCPDAQRARIARPLGSRRRWSSPAMPRSPASRGPSSKAPGGGSGSPATSCRGCGDRPGRRGAGGDPGGLP